jgi:glycosyltransferase involved in cell wall biosynthesis
MKILHTENSQGWGGQEIRILSEMRGMIARGHTLELACAPGARIEEEARRAGIPVTVLPIAKKRLGGMLALRRFIATRGFDVINTHSSTDSWLTALACATLSNAPPIVRTRHISAPVPANAATRWLYTRATKRIVTTGEALKQQLVRDNGFPAESIVSIPTGIELTRFVPRGPEADVRGLRARAGVPTDRRVIGIVATLRSWKGHRYLIEAFAALGREDVTLLIVGDGPQRAALEGLVAGLRLGDRVVFAGNQADVVPWLQAIDVFALPSYANEGVPQAILQAFACALPVVTTDAGAIGEVARDGDTALVVQKENAADLARGLARALDDASLARTLGANALALVHARHGHPAMLDAMEAVFRAATARR